MYLDSTQKLRPYQQDAVDAINSHLCSKDTNPCVVIPTGGGKTHVIAALLDMWKKDAPHFRAIVLAHRKELVAQNAAKFYATTGQTAGIWSAGLGRKDGGHDILFASIDSVYKRSGEFDPWDVIFVDEAHRIPPKGEGKYRTFIKGCRRWNPNLRVVGLTATPFRMTGPLCHRDHILNEVVYEAKIRDLIDQGYLCRLRSKIGDHLDLTQVKRNPGGDYVVRSLAERVNRDAIVSAAIEDVLRIIKAEKRKAAVFFCVDIDHCRRVSAELERHGINAPYLTGKTKQHGRDKIIRDFAERRIPAVCCVNVLTEGWDAPHVDTIVLLRPTLSRGLYAQMVGRGLRLDPGKEDCLVLDYANCIEQHGPIDLLSDNDYVAMATCGNCKEVFSRQLGECPRCGWKIPPKVAERLEATERERRMHDTKASGKSILAEPETYKVDEVYIGRHQKPGKPDSLRVQYRCGVKMFREWVCLDHTGYAGVKAQAWWRERFGNRKPVRVRDALENLHAPQVIKDYTDTITVVNRGKYHEVIGYNKGV